MIIKEKVAQQVDLNVACIPSNYTRLIARELGLQVRDLQMFLGMSRLSVEQFLQEDRLITPRQQIQVIENSLRLTKDEVFGLNLGKRYTLSTHGAMGFLANSSPNLKTALQALKTFLPTRLNFARLELVTQGDWLEIDCFFDIDINDDVLRILSEIFATVFFECSEFIVGRPLREVMIDFAHAEPEYSQRYAEFFPGQFQFSMPQIKVKIPMDICEVPNVSADHENYLMAWKQCEAMLAQLHSNKHSCKYKVQKMMLSDLPGALSEEDTAAELFISKRTLARRLKKEDTSFRQIRDEILSQQAIGYLRDSDMSVEAIAVMLNYHDSSNFRRAFKRWFKMSPDQYRQQIATE